MTSPLSKIGFEIPRTRTYLRDHWAGRHPLAISFWVNLVALRLVVIAVETYILEPFAQGSLAGLIATVLYLLFAHIVVFTWQIVGLVRACDRYQVAFGTIAVVWGVHAGIVISLFFTIVSSFTTFQNSFIVRDDGLLFLVWEQERAAKYSLELSRDGARLQLDGSFELGVTKKLRALLEENPKVEALVLASSGGNTYEGRGIAKLVQTHRLDTYVFKDCFSTCTLAFAAGERRSLGPSARLGFHQYGLDASYEIPYLDIAKEQEIDRKFFLSRGIDEAFLEHVFAAAHEDLWIPDHRELLKAGVAHGLVEEF